MEEEQLDREQLRNSLYGFEVREPDKRRVVEKKAPDIQQMWARSFEIVGMAACGMKNVEIAEVLNITPQTVSNTLNSELGMKRMSELRESRDEDYKNVKKRIDDLTIKALDIYDRILDAEDNDPEINLDKKLKVSDTVMLELSGHRAAHKVHALTTSATLDEIEEFKKRGREAAKEAGMLVELEEGKDYESKEETK